LNSFNARSSLRLGQHAYTFYRLDALSHLGRIRRLPFSIRILLENLLRNEDGHHVKREDIEALARWDARKASHKEIAFTPARVVLQDFTGVPCLVDLAAMRDQIAKMGGDPARINPLEPVDLVIDHSVQVDRFGSPDAFRKNVALEFERNQERYQFLRWGQRAFKNFRVVPPGTGIVHQVNLEYLASVVVINDQLIYPDTLVGADSHTTMINGLGVLGWGVGGIEAEAAMLGQPVSLLIPEVVGFKLFGELQEGRTATDLVLTVTEGLRKKGVVGKFVEFYGEGLDSLSLPDRATVANMCPEYGATVGFFPIDQRTLDYLRLTGREEGLVERVEAYAKEQGLFRTRKTPEPIFSDTIELDLSRVEPSLAGPKRPQDRVALKDIKASFHQELSGVATEKKERLDPNRIGKWWDEGGQSVQTTPGRVSPSKTSEVGLDHGSVVIAAITSCTNTSNPAVMVGAGLVARKAVARGLTVPPWVKTSLAPGSKVVVDYLRATKLLGALEKLKFHLVGFGCTTCIGNSGPIPEPVAREIVERDLVAVSVLSGNRNFEGRINPLARFNYLTSPPLVVAYAIAGTVTVDFLKEPVGNDRWGKPVYLRDIWPSQKEINQAMRAIDSKMFRRQYAHVFEGDRRWQSISIPSGQKFAWDLDSTYVKSPPFFDGVAVQPKPLEDIDRARALVVLGDSVTTDHISPAGSIPKDSPAGQYLIACGISGDQFNSYGARRGNHEVMVRGTFANIRLRNLLVPGTEGGVTRHLPSGGVMPIYEAAMRYRQEDTPLIVIAGKEYGAGSSRDWAAKGPALLGVRAVIAESFERIHRSNLIGMGVLPLELKPAETVESLGLTGEEVFSITGIKEDLKAAKMLTVTAQGPAETRKFNVRARIDTPVELAYYQHGGILPYVLRQLTSRK